MLFKIEVRRQNVIDFIGTNITYIGTIIIQRIIVSVFISISNMKNNFLRRLDILEEVRRVIVSLKLNKINRL